MTLHEAMEKLFLQVGQPMTTTEVAMELNTNKWYQKKDGSLITPYQIYGRAKNYPTLFHRKGSTISLIGGGTIKEVALLEKPKRPIRANKIPTKDIVLLEKVLMNEQNFKPAEDIDKLVPNSPGLYCIRIKDRDKLPKPFNNFILERGHSILYIGIASQSLKKRFLHQELRAKGHGTFFRSIGTVLTYKPPEGSLVEKRNKRNYKFSKNHEQLIIEWINKNLIVNWVEFSRDLYITETMLIAKYLPLLNLDKNPATLQLLSDLRKECVDIANRSLK